MIAQPSLAVLAIFLQKSIVLSIFVFVFYFILNHDKSKSFHYSKTSKHLFQMEECVYIDQDKQIAWFSSIQANHLHTRLTKK